MVHLLFPRNNGDQNFICSMALPIGLFLSIIALIALCVKHGRSRKYHMATIDQESNNYEEKILAPKSSQLLLSTKQLITNISSKTMPKKFGEKSKVTKSVSNDHNEGGLWQKAILMGEKCKPPQFSGVIYYDPFGNRVNELPRSPRASTPMGNIIY